MEGSIGWRVSRVEMSLGGRVSMVGMSLWWTGL